MHWKYATGLVDEVTHGAGTAIRGVDSSGSVVAYRDIKFRAMDAAGFPENKEAVFVVSPRVTVLPPGWKFVTRSTFIAKFTEFEGRAPTNKEL
jgi:hypothetical protein